MQVEKTHHVDADEPDADGEVEWRYEYDLYRFSDGARTLVARSYADAPQEAHFLRFETNGRFEPITARHLDKPLVRDAVLYLRSAGMVNLRYLASSGYEPLPSAA